MARAVASVSPRRNSKRASRDLNGGRTEDEPRGIAIDAYGGPVVDPTENVIALTKAAVTRIDDLADLRELLVEEKVKRMYSELTNQEKISVLRAEHYKELRHMEADRVDKIRSVDVANAAATAAQLLSAVNTLATTAQTTAEVLRNQVAATATAVASQTERALNPILDRIALLEKSSYTGAGKAGVSEPQQAQLLDAVNKLAEARSMSTGKSEGYSASWLILLGAVTLISVFIAIGGAVISYAERQPVPPQVIYATPPPSTQK